MDVNTQEAMESKMTVGSEMEMAGVMGKLKETAGLEAEMVAGMESGVDTEVGMDSKLTADRWQGSKQAREAQSQPPEVMWEQTCD